MGVVASATLDESMLGVSMNLRERFFLFLVAIEAAAFEPKTPAAADAMTLSTLHIGNRRVMRESLKLRRRILAHKEANFLAAPFPDDRQSVFAR